MAAAGKNDGFESFAAAHERALAATSIEAFDTAMAAVRACPQAADYAVFYARRRAGLSRDP